MKLLTRLLVVSVLLAVAFAGNTNPASPYKFIENAAKLPSDGKPSGSYRILHPDGRVQIINYGANNNRYFKHEQASYVAQPYETRSPTTSRPYTTTSVPDNGSIKGYLVPDSVYPAVKKQTPSMPIPYTAPISSPYDDPTYVTSNVDLSTLFRETASRKFLRL